MPDSALPAALPSKMPTEAHLTLDIVCLCADWCGTCREYEAAFAELQRTVPGHRFRWIDIEDEAALVGDIDVETFPTLMLAHDGRVLFAGPVLPRLSDAQRLVAVQVEALTQSMAQSGAGTGTLTGALPGVQPDQALAYAELARRLTSAPSANPAGRSA